MAVVLRPALEWPTLAVAAAIYTGYGLLTLNYHSLPWWLVLPAGGFLLAWHGSLQHEVVHGHPTRWRWLNRALVFPSLWLRLPLEVYAETHLRHHHDQLITDPLADPESYYLSKRDWARAGPVRRAVLRFHNTSVGRLLIGPLVSLLYLNNNLHYMHHEAPGAAWYRLPGRWRVRRSEVLAANGGYRYSGYG